MPVADTCSTWGDRTRYGVVETRRTRQSRHAELAMARVIEEEDLPARDVEWVTGPRCGSADGVEMLEVTG